MGLRLVGLVSSNSKVLPGVGWWLGLSFDCSWLSDNNATSVTNDFYYLSRSPYSFQVFGPLSVEVFPLLKYPLTPWLFGVSVTSSTATRRYVRVASAS